MAFLVNNNVISQISFPFLAILLNLNVTTCQKHRRNPEVIYKIQDQECVRNKNEQIVAFKNSFYTKKNNDIKYIIMNSF